MSMSRRAFGALAGAVAAGHASAQAPRSFAVLSEFARDLNVVFNQESTGSRLGNDIQKSTRLPDGALDKVALFAARDAIRKAEPGAGVWLVSPLDTDLFGALRTYEVGDRLAMPDDIAEEMKKRQCTHLLLLARLRAEGELQMADSSERTPPLDGIGFYVNRNAPMKTTDTLEVTRGYLAPFMYARLVLIEVPAARVAAARSVRHAPVVVNVRKDVDTPDPWMAIKNDEKGPYLARMIQQQLAKALPLLLAAG